MYDIHKTLFFIFCFFLCTVSIFSAEEPGAEKLNDRLLSKEQILDHLYQGNRLFREAIESSKNDPVKSKDLYLKSAMHFERIVNEGGIQNGKLFYNIGNAYFRTGDIGKAILFYKRASLLIPHDLNLIKNLEYARSKRIDKIEEKDQVLIFRTLFFWHYELSPGIKFILFIVTFFILWICLTLLLFFKKTFLKWGAVIAAVITVIFFGSLLIDFISSSVENPGVILSKEVIARKGDSEAYEQSYQKPLHTGTEFNLLEKRREWYHIELIDGTKCWIPEKDARLVKL